MLGQCTSPDCNRPAYCKSLCKRHYGNAKMRQWRALIVRPVPPDLPGERWLPIVGYEGWYEVSDLGRIKRVAAGRGSTVGRILRDQDHRDGRRSITLKRSREQHTFLVHRLVAAAFHPIPDYPCEVNHKDGQPANNRADNLEWVTKSENGFHAYRVLGRKSVPGYGMRKLTEEQVTEIRAAIGVSQTELGRRYGVDQTTISCILRHQTWR